MKKFNNLTFVLLIALIANCQSQPTFERVDNSEIDQSRLEFVTSLSKNILTAQRMKGFYDLSEDEATPKILSGLDESTQKQSYQKIKSAFGDFQDLNFDHMMKPLDGTLYEVYRFKASFNSEAYVEVRAVLDANGKLAGFFVKPWKENL